MKCKIVSNRYISQSNYYKEIIMKYVTFHLFTAKINVNVGYIRPITLRKDRTISTRVDECVGGGARALDSLRARPKREG